MRWITGSHQAPEREQKVRSEVGEVVPAQSQSRQQNLETLARALQSLTGHRVQLSPETHVEQTTGLFLFIRIKEGVSLVG